MLVWVNEKPFFAVISLVWCLMSYYELEFSSHDHSDTKQAQPWSCIGRYRGHGLKLHNHDSAVMLVWVNEKAIFCSDFSRVVFDELL